MKKQIYMIDGFEYEYSGEIVGVITKSNEDLIAFHFKPDNKQALDFFNLMLTAELTLPVNSKYIKENKLS